MPGYEAIAAVSSALVEVLETARRNTEFENSRVALFQASQFANPPKDTVSLYLFRAVVNGNLRDIPPVRLSEVERESAPLRLDLHYLLTAWAGSAMHQQRLLGWAARTLAHSPVIPATQLNNHVTDSMVLSDDDSLVVCFEPLSIQDMTSIWEGTKAQQQPSLVLMVPMVPVR
ncbi:MAG: DUF4255 domain-containing protein [Bryobacterales bacterium]|nr:DUF4255 domain-containing protein [Bryobacterales bacterium]